MIAYIHFTIYSTQIRIESSIIGTMERNTTITPNHDLSPRRYALRISERRLLLRFGDWMAINVAILIALFIWSVVAQDVFNETMILEQIIWFALLPTIWFILASANDYYDLEVAAKRILSLRKLFQITLQLVIIYIFIFFFSDRDSLPRLFIFYYGIASFGLIAIWRILNPALIGWVMRPRRLLILGNGEAEKSLVETLNTTQHQAYEIKGVLPLFPSDQDIDPLQTWIDREQITDLVITSLVNVPNQRLQEVLDAYEQGITITPMPLLYEELTGRVPVKHINDQWTLFLPLSETSILNPNSVIKRVTDIVFSLIGLILLAILMPLIAVIIWIDSRGTIFYQQARVGLHGKTFQMWKFRTMIPNAESKTGAVYAQKNDIRITRVGKWLRKSRIDELPQLWNVLKGDMSLIGPRPERPEHVMRLQEQYPLYRARHVVRPGITGWAQVQFQYGATDEDALIKLQYDLYYIRHQSFGLDIDISIRTIGKIISLSGQ